MPEITDFSIYTLSTPLKIDIIETGEYFYASNNDFEIYSCGESEEEAIENFKVYLEEMYVRAKKLVELVE